MPIFYEPSPGGGAGGGAPTGASYVTLSLDATLTSERVLTGTASQVVITDGGAGTTVTLSTPQDIATTSTPIFADLEISNLTLGGIVIGGGAGADLTTLGVATNGQIPIGDGAGAPTLATITAGTGISVTNAAGSITIASTGAVAQESGLRHLITGAMGA